MLGTSSDMLKECALSVSWQTSGSFQYNQKPHTSYQREPCKPGRVRSWRELVLRRELEEWGEPAHRGEPAEWGKPECQGELGRARQARTLVKAGQKKKVVLAVRAGLLRRADYPEGAGGDCKKPRY